MFPLSPTNATQDFRWCPIVVLLVLLVGPAAPAAAQQSEAQAIRLAAAGFIDKDIPLMSGYNERADRILMSAPLPWRIEGGKMVQTAQAPARPDAESRELGTVLQAVAMSTDTIWCDLPRGPCHGTEGIQVRLGDPEVRGDSATVLFELQVRGRPSLGERASHTVRVWYAVYLVRESGRWHPVAFSGADPRGISPPHPIGPDGLPVKRLTGGEEASKPSPSREYVSLDLLRSGQRGSGKLVMRGWGGMFSGPASLVGGARSESTNEYTPPTVGSTVVLALPAH